MRPQQQRRREWLDVSGWKAGRAQHRAEACAAHTRLPGAGQEKAGRVARPFCALAFVSKQRYVTPECSLLSLMLHGGGRTGVGVGGWGGGVVVVCECVCVCGGGV